MISKRSRTVEGLTESIKELRLTNEDVFFICIGTDRSTGDSYGPLVGTMLVKAGYQNVIGTLDDPIHAVNLSEKLRELPADKTIIAIDASLGRIESVGIIELVHGPISPGAGVGKELPEVGDYSINAIVNIGGFMEYIVLQNTRLSFVMNMADITCSSIIDALPVRVSESLIL